jgi:hypothetical protein
VVGQAKGVKGDPVVLEGGHEGVSQLVVAQRVVQLAQQVAGVVDGGTAALPDLVALTVEDRVFGQVPLGGDAVAHVVEQLPQTEPSRTGPAAEVAARDGAVAGHIALQTVILDAARAHAEVVLGEVQAVAGLVLLDLAVRDPSHSPDSNSRFFRLSRVN